MNIDPNDLTRPLGGLPEAPSANSTPTKIGRFLIQSILGQGGFGVVYLAIDEQLQRKVALKVPHPALVERPEDTELYLKEARTVAGLEHPNIVSVLEVGSTLEYPIFVVSKYVEGCDLAVWLKTSQPSIELSARWIAELAEALRYAHKKGIVHRDVKPQNVLIDSSEIAYLVDFGLALREEDVGKRLPTAGTPAYMSPEQARGEGHRVDGRSDIFSLGVVSYELLAGRRPFSGDSHLELFEQINELDPKPIRQWNESVDRELERICLKMLAKRKSERYSSAKDLIEDLDAFLAASKPSGLSIGAHPPRISSPDKSPSDTLQPFPGEQTPIATTPTSGSKTLRIVPKGLRSFDQHDAEFFLELLPGPRDRSGLPNTIGFWRTRIEERDANNTFNVGLVYGPSGCGKSSMMKAGLLPRLSSDVLTLYVEATTDQTESKLLAMLQRQLDAEQARYDRSLGLVDLVSAVRRGRVLPSGKKVLFVIDQFEQWLYSHTHATGTELLDALLQCDGARLQAVVMVRDDFWMAATRFFRDLDIPLVEGHNSAAVDLFTSEHAVRVLKAFGLAFGKSSNSESDEKAEYKRFLADSVRGLAEENKVNSVRLSLFAEMMKNRPWTPESLREVGGTAGIGSTFLEETFSASGAPPAHRYHQVAARAVLRSLLPDSGTEIKGHRRSRVELLTASGYEFRDKDFVELMRILDSELRLITPVDDSNVEEEVPFFDAELKTSLSTSSGQKSALTTAYQLTHDYLVPSLREWVTRKQRETKRGRAELRLEERAAAWNARRETKQLPTLTEWIGISWLTERKKWTEPQRAMMRGSNWFHGLRTGSLCVLLAFVGISGLVAKDYLTRQTQSQVREDLLRRATEREALATTLAERNKVGEAVALLVPELFEDLRKHQEAPEIRRVAESLDKKRHEWNLLLELRRVTIDEQEKRINSFEVGKFAPLDLSSDTLVKVCLQGEFSDKKVAEFVQFMKGTSYTRDQHDEIINALGQALLLQMQEHNLPPLSIPEEEQKAAFLEGLAKIDRLERLLRGVWRGGTYEVPGVINRNRYNLMLALGRNNEVGNISRSPSRYGSSYPTISFFPDVLRQISTTKTRDPYVLGLANDASAVAPQNLAAALLAASITYHVYRAELTEARKAERLLELAAIYQRCLEIIPNNPFLLGQYGRVALDLAVSQEYLPDSALTLFSGRAVAVEVLTKCLDLCHEKGIPVPPDLQFDTARACILGRYQADRGRILLEGLHGQFDDPDFAQLLLQRACAMTGHPVDIYYAEKLADNYGVQQKYPMEVAAIFTRLQGVDIERQGMWVAALERLFADIQDGRPEMQPVVQRIMTQTKWLSEIPSTESLVFSRQNVAQEVYGLDFCASNIAAKQADTEFPSVACSFISQYDRIECINDGIVDFRIERRNRWTSFQSPNLSDWIAIDFGGEREFCRIALYIYEDSGVLPPASFDVQTLVGEDWLTIPNQKKEPEVPTSNRPNIVSFERMNARKIRVVFQHPARAKSGITEIFVSNSEESETWIRRAPADRLKQLAEIEESLVASKVIDARLWEDVRRWITVLTTNGKKPEGTLLANLLAQKSMECGTYEDKIKDLQSLFDLQYDERQAVASKSTLQTLIQLTENNGGVIDLYQYYRSVMPILESQCTDNPREFATELSKKWESSQLSVSDKYNLACASLHLSERLKLGPESDRIIARELYERSVNEVVDQLKSKSATAKHVLNDPDCEPIRNDPRITPLLRNL